MIRLQSIEHDGQRIPLTSSNAFYSKANVFTVIVGKNGVGKSRLLSTIARQCIAPSEEYDGRFASRSQQASPVVIAASTSPFDKFPSPQRRRGQAEKNYRYIGMRGEGMYAATSSVALLSSVTRGMLLKLLQGGNRANLLELFSSLSFDSSFEFILKPMFSPTMAPGFGRIRALEGRREYFIDQRFGERLSRMSMDERSAIEYAIDNVGEFFDRRKVFGLRIDFSTGESSLQQRRIEAFELNSILMLMEAGLVRLMDIRGSKRDQGEISLRSASSGEQCVLVLVLGIASYIENGSLILIDEPEISLHPEWQEGFMGLLMSCFANYSQCQFVIATHSPQITARLSGATSFVYSLSKKTLIRASEFSDRSADFQLAELFDSPGRMNEYVSRISFNLIAVIRAGKAAESETKEGMVRLVALKAKIDFRDPMFQLIESVEELYRQNG